MMAGLFLSLIIFSGSVFALVSKSHIATCNGLTFSGHQSLVCLMKGVQDEVNLWYYRLTTHVMLYLNTTYLGFTLYPSPHLVGFGLWEKFGVQS